MSNYILLSFFCSISLFPFFYKENAWLCHAFSVCVLDLVPFIFVFSLPLPLFFALKGVMFLLFHSSFQCQSS